MAETQRSPIRGSLCALITPFQEGAVDLAAVRRLTAWHIEQGTHGLVPCGTTGESPVLSHDEWSDVVRACVEEAAGRVPVIAGTGSNNTQATIEKTLAAQALGADAALVVVPYYNRPDQAGLLAHFTAVHDATGLPIVTYNVPGRTVAGLAVETLARLAALPRIIGVKDADGDVARVDRLRALAGPEFIQLAGEDAIALGFNAHGGHGCISVTANAAPALCAALQTTSLEGDMAAARTIQDRLIALHDALFCEPSPQPVKYAVSRLGLARDEVRLPLVPASRTARDRVDAALARAGLAPAPSR